MKNTIVLSIVLSVAALCMARNITVDDDGPVEFNNIQAAIDAASDGDTVIIATGLYVGAGNRDIDFMGKAITIRSTCPSDPNAVACAVIPFSSSYYKF